VGTTPTDFKASQTGSLQRAAGDFSINFRILSLGMYGGQISDRLGRRIILLLGCGFSAVGYITLA